LNIKFKFIIYFKIIIFATVIIISGCGLQEENKNIVIFGVEASPTSFDPRYATDALSTKLTHMIFSSLFKIDEKGEVIPDIVENYSTEGLTYTFKIKKGIVFHSGKELTAEDVKFTFDSIKNPKSSSPHRLSFEKLKEIKVIDKYTVLFKLYEHFAPFLTSLTIGIIPYGSDITAFKTKPIGSGPFILKEWYPDEDVFLIANEKYFGGKPKVEGVKFRIIPDGTTRVLEVVKGGVDIIQNEIPPDAVGFFKENKNLQILISDSNIFAYMGFNLRDNYLSNINVRKAIAYAINRDEIIEKLLGGLAKKSDSLLPCAHWAYTDKVTLYSYDIKKANQLLDEAGFFKKDGGIRFKLTLKTTSNDLRRQMAEVLQESFAKIGIKLQVKFYEWGTFYSDIKKGNFQLITLQWVGIVDPDIYHYIFSSKSVPPYGANRGWFIDSDIDKLVEAGRINVNKEKRKEIYVKLQQILSERLPYVNLWHLKNIAVVRNRIKGYKVYLSGDFYSLKDVEIR